MGELQPPMNDPIHALLFSFKTSTPAGLYSRPVSPRHSHFKRIDNEIPTAVSAELHDERDARVARPTRGDIPSHEYRGPRVVVPERVARLCLCLLNFAREFRYNTHLQQP
jgi:hypothetical protein